MYFKYSLEDDGHVITDGKQTLARLQVKTEKLVKYMHHVELYSGLQLKLKSDALWSTKNFQIFSEHNELVGTVKSQGNAKLLLEMQDKLILKYKYSFEKQSGNLLIKNEAGIVIALFSRKFVWQKFRSFLFIEEKDLDKLIFEDRLLIYALAFVSKKLL